MKLKPLGDRIVVKPKDEDEATTTSGLVIPDTAKDKPQTGTVIAVGPEARHDDADRIPMDVSEGDVVVFSEYAGTKFKQTGGDELLVLRESDILAIVS